MKNYIRLTLLIFVMLTSLLACSIFETDAGPFSGNSSKSTNTSRSTFTDTTEVEIIELDVKSDMRTNTLNIHSIKLDEGQVNLRLFDPNHEVEWEETLTAAEEFTKKIDLEPIPGLWQLELEIEDASGSYVIRWEGKN